MRQIPKRFQLLMRSPSLPTLAMRTRVGSAGRSPSVPRRNGLRKCPKDVAEIVATARGYQKIYCVTAQFARAKERARIEDELTKQYGVPITILDRTWPDVDFAKRQLTVARSEWKGPVTMPKGGRIRYVPMTRRLTETLREARHLRGPRVLSDGTGKPLTQKVIQVLVRRTARRANVKPGIHILRHRSARTWRCVAGRRGPSRNWPGTRI